MLSLVNMGYIFGKSTSRYLNIIGQSEPFIQNQYLIIEDELQGNVPCEVIETSIYPMMVDSIMPEGCSVEFMKQLNLDANKVTYLARVKVLKDLPYPLMPSSKVFKSTYEDIADIITNASVNDSMILGVIRGTESANYKLPDEISDIAPLWQNGKAIGQIGIPFMMNHHKFKEYPHIGIFGSTGSGKSRALAVLCEELMNLNIPALAFDPHQELSFNGQMEGLSSKFIKDYSDKHKVFNIGVDVGIKFTDLDSNELIRLFDYVNKLTEPQANVIEVLYEKGDTFANLQNKINSLKKAFEMMDRPKREQEPLSPNEVILYSKCKDKVSGVATLQALSWKCTALENTRIFSCGIEAVENSILNGKFSVIRGDISRLKMVSSYVINKLYLKRRCYAEWKPEYSTDKPDFFPPFFIVVDEAHNFAPADDKIYSPTKTQLRTISQEARKYGVFLALCTQRPKAIDKTLVSQLNTKFIFRLNDVDDMNIARVEGNLTDEEVSMLPDLQSGNCYVSSAILNKTYPVRFRSSFTKAPHSVDPFTELDKYLKTIKSNDISTILEKFLPIKTDKIAQIHPSINQELNRIATIDEIIEGLNKLVQSNRATVKGTPFGKIYTGVLR